MSRRYALPIAAAALALTASYASGAPIDPSSPTGAWDPILYPLIDPDPIGDEQTGISEADIVGDPGTPGLYWQFDDASTADPTDGNIGFRVRLADDSGPGGFDAYFAIGLDADTDGDIDLFLGVNNRGSADEVAIWDAGSGLNTGPSTTSIATPALVSYTQTAANYDWSLVSAANDPGQPTDFDGGGANDYFLSFVVPFADVVAALGGLPVPITFDDQSVVQFVAATANQANSLNQDLGGIDGGVSSASTWAALGGFTLLSQVNPPAPIPEPTTAALVAFGLVGMAIARRRA